MMDVTDMLISTTDQAPRIPLRLGRCLGVSGAPTLARCHIISVEGALRTPIDGGLTRRVHAALRSGARRVRLDLSRLSSIDAAGIGELVTALNATRAAGGLLDISHATGRIRHILEVTGVYRLMTVCGASAVNVYASHHAR